MLWIIIVLLVNLLIETSVSLTVVVPPDPIEAHVGSTVILPCWISPPENAEALEIRWYHQDQFNNPVLLYNHGKIQDIQECFRNRSSLTLRSDQSGGLKDGDVSLRLEKLTFQDEGLFHCYVSGEHSYNSKVVVLKITDSSGLWKAISISLILLICVLLSLLGLILYKYRHKRTGHEEKTLADLKNRVCEDETMERLTKEEEPKKEPDCEEGTLKKQKKEVCEDETMERLTKEANSEEPKKEPDCEEGTLKKRKKEVVEDINIEELRKHAVEITIDRKRSHPGLIVSEDCKMVKDRPEYKYTGEGFPYQLRAFGAQRFTSGRHYWEVELKQTNIPPKIFWIIGVEEGNFTKRKSFLCSDGPRGFYINTDPPVKLSLTPRPERLGVLFDYDHGQLSFYNVTERKHLLTISSRFSGSVVPLFNPGAGDLSALIILDLPKPVEPDEPSQPLLSNTVAVESAVELVVKSSYNP